MIKPFVLGAFEITSRYTWWFVISGVEYYILKLILLIFAKNFILFWVEKGRECSGSVYNKNPLSTIHANFSPLASLPKLDLYGNE